MTEEILILHGWQNRRPDGHWQRWLAAELASRGSTVHYPQLPEPDAPVLDDWIDAVESQLRDTDAASLTVVAHSLGCLLWRAPSTWTTSPSREAATSRSTTATVRSRSCSSSPPADGARPRGPCD